MEMVPLERFPEKPKGSSDLSNRTDMMTHVNSARVKADILWDCEAYEDNLSLQQRTAKT